MSDTNGSNGNNLPNIPNPIVECAGCSEDLSLLVPHLKVMVKAEQQVLLTSDAPTTGEGEIAAQQITLGTRSGRGRIMQFHDFDCLGQYAEDRAGAKAKLEAHAEDEIYEPEDNRSPEELVEAGELPGAYLDYQSALEEGSD